MSPVIYVPFEHLNFELSWKLLREFWRSLPSSFPIKSNHNEASIKRVLEDLHDEEQLTGMLAMTASQPFSPVGIFLVEVGEDLWSNEYLATEKSLYVTPKFRGQGIPTELVVRTIDHLKSYDIQRLDVGVTLPGSAATTSILYESLGFEFQSTSYTKVLNRVQKADKEGH